MTVSQHELDALWDFGDPAASADRLARSARRAAGAGDRVAAAELQTQVARTLGLRERFDEAVAELDAIDESLDPAVATRVALERGRVLNSRGLPAEAVPVFERAAELAADAGLTFLRIDALHMLGIADPEHAEEWTARALAELEAVTDRRTLRWRIGLLNNLGWTRFDAGALDSALEAFEGALAAAEDVGTPQQVTWAHEAIAECRAAIADRPPA